MTSLEALALMHVRVLPWRWDRRTPSDWADVLAAFPLFRGVSKRRLRKLVRYATLAELAPGETIISPVDYGNYLYVILGGTVEAISRPAARTLRTGDYFGELALIDGRPRPATIVARSDVHLMKLPSRSVVKLAREHSTFTIAVFRDLAPRLLQFEADGAG
jgi:CRP/FNR family transcriptional regulator, cyclic AMP receptor protein